VKKTNYQHIDNYKKYFLSSKSAY